MTKDYPAKDASATEPLLYDKNKSSIDRATDVDLKTEDDGTRRARGLDLSKYRQPELVAALDRITSLSYSLKLLIQPSLKIAWRSLIYQDANVRLQDLLTRLGGVTKTFFPPKEESSEATSASGAQDTNQRAAPRPTRRSVADRILHFIIVGLPLSILVGVLYGILNFVTCMWNDIWIVWTYANNLFIQARSDLQYYRQHPEERPTKDETIKAWTQQVVRPYSQEFIRKKLGIFGFAAPPIAKVVEYIGIFFAHRSADNLEKYAAAAMQFSPWRDRNAKTPASQYNYPPTAQQSEYKKNEL